MEGKQHLEMEGIHRSKSTCFSSLAILVLSLLLSACVAAIIYISIHPATTTMCQTPGDTIKTEKQQAPVQDDYPTVSKEEQHQEQTIKDKANLNIKNEDGTHISEEVEYDETREVAIFHGPNGEFEMDDFKKGTRVIKDTDQGDCYVIPVGTNKTAGHELRDYVKQYHGQEIQPHKGKTYRAEILPGAIDDTSFLPQEARKECAVFYWMSVTGEDTESDEEVDTGLRKKRAICRRRRCRLLYYLGRFYWYCYNYYYVC